jgi:two-component system, NtrC family, sensor kinase
MKTAAKSILLVDDSEANLEILSEPLIAHGYRVRAVKSGAGALKTIEVELPDLVLLDIKMPVMDGYEVCRLLKAEERTRGIPVIFISGMMETQEKVKAFEAGGVDYITKPLQTDEVLERVRTHIELQDMRERLEKMNVELEARVAERTQQLEKTVEQLREEIRERELAEEALRKSEERFRLVADYSYDWESWIGPGGRIIWINPAVKRITGYTPDEYLNLPDHIQMVVHPDDYEKVQPALGKALKERLFADDFVFRIVTKNREMKWVAASYQPIYSDAGEYLGLRVSINDITEKKLIEEEAIRSAQLASIGEIAAGVAHEINNPIMGVINYAQILLNRNKAQGGDSAMPQRIIKEGERIAKIVKSLLTFVRSAPEVSSVCAVQMIVEDSYALLQKLFMESGVKTIINLPPELPCVFVQTQKIQQVCINILSNALFALNMKYPSASEEKILEISGLTVADDERSYLRVVFYDRGSGISEEVLGKICNPFFTTKPAGKGTGLGLSISHNIIKEHGGRLLFESRLGEFSKVMVDLPLANETLGSGARIQE